MSSHWIIASASVRGESHVKTGAPCQDESVIKTTPDGKWVALVVSDGAGTANRADEGSKHVVKYFSEELLKLVIALEDQPPGNWINDFVIEKVLETRKSLRNLAQTDNIRDFNCTLVACLQGPNGGFSIHIGDGSIVGGYRDESNGDEVGRLFVSKPENGEYANETFFITEKDWIRHLRITPMPKLDWVLCCTDGGGALALVNDEALKIGFLEPVMESVFGFDDAKSRGKVLAEYLSDVKSNKVTGDDKTLALAIRPGKVQNLQWYASTKVAKVNLEPTVIGKTKPPTPNQILINSSPRSDSLPKNASDSSTILNIKHRKILLLTLGVIIILITLAFLIMELFFSPTGSHEARQESPAQVQVLDSVDQVQTKTESNAAPENSFSASKEKPELQPEMADKSHNTKVLTIRAHGPR
jgi:hypothetical protein